jgi:hypothetical protein
VLVASLAAPLEAVFPHQTLNALLADAHTLGLQLAMNSRTAVGLAAALVRCGDLDRELSVALGPSGFGTLLPCVEAAPRDTKERVRIFV